jgi:hypothetical protein
MAMHSSSRNGAKVIWLAVHTTEGIMRAADLRDWTAWAGSSHASSDETGVLMTPADGFVPYDRAAWTLRNGNSISENIEQCGWARWTRAEWLARPKLLDATARWLADRSKARGIPLVKLSPADVRARKPGVLGHGDYSTGTGDGTHWDPGPNYPWDVVLSKARAYANGDNPQEDDMTPAQAAQLQRIEDVLMRKRGGGVQDNHNVVKATLAEVRALRSVVQTLAESKGVDGDAILAEVRESVDAALDGLSITLTNDGPAA